MPRPTFTPDELALLADVHAAPRDDRPRLAYADWLEEHGQPDYGTFIRLSCRVRTPVSWRKPAVGWYARQQAELDKTTRPDERARLQGLLDLWQVELAARDLLVPNAKAWAAPLPPSLKLREYARGLPRAAVTPAALESPPLAKMSPRLRLTVEIAAADLGRHLTNPLLGRTDDLLVLAAPGQALGEDVVRSLAACPHLGTLERLMLRPLAYDAMAACKELLEPRVDVRANIRS